MLTMVLASHRKILSKFNVQIMSFFRCNAALNYLSLKYDIFQVFLISIKIQ